MEYFHETNTQALGIHQKLLLGRLQVLREDIKWLMKEITDKSTWLFTVRNFTGFPGGIGHKEIV